MILVKSRESPWPQKNNNSDPPIILFKKTGTITLRISKFGFNLFQFGTVSVLVLLAVIYFICDLAFGQSAVTKLMGIFDPVKEASITTVFAMLNLLISSILLFVIYLNRRKLQRTGSRYWLILSIIFFALSIDEVAQLHERSGNMIADMDAFSSQVHESFNPDFVFTGFFALVVFVAFIPFLWQLTRRTFVLFLVAGGIFVSGALLLELVELFLLQQKIADEGDALLVIRSIVEEVCELYGIAIFNFALFDLIPQRQIMLK